MKKLLATTAFIALLAGPALAQNDNSQPTQLQPPAATQPLDQSAPDANAPAMTPQTDQGTTAAPTDQNAAPDTAQTPAPADQKTATAQSGDTFVAQQGATDQLASKWMGAAVYDNANNKLGSINDLVLDKDGKVTAVVIGVGGFLGIGEKSVAIAFPSIQPSTDDNGNPKLVVNVGKDQIDNAPDFMTLADIKAKEAAPPASNEQGQPAAQQ